jgi:hypothetical protein
MPATIEIDEANGAGETLSHNIANSNMGNVDAKELVAVNYPITPGESSYEKWQKIHITAMGGSSKIDNLKIWRTGALGGSATHKTNARTSSYGGAPTYAQPVKTVSTIATQAMPTSEPATANLGIGGSLTGSLTAVGSSDYLVHQITTDAGDVAGSSSTAHYQYDEVA